MASPPAVAAAALLTRKDGRVLLVRHRDDDGAFAGRWSLPMEVVAPHELVEEALERGLRERLHVEPGPYEFAETLYLVGEGGARVVVNAFACTGWSGEPHFGGRDYADAAWVGPAEFAAALAGDPEAGSPALGEALLPELRAWLAQELGAGPAGDQRLSLDAAPRSAEALAMELTEARTALLAAFEALTASERARPLDGGWTPLDVLVHAGSVEAYYAAEARRLLEMPGHAWRAFNEGQWEAEQRSRAPLDEAEARARLARARAETEAWLRPLDETQLGAYGLHAERGAVTIANRIAKIATHDREHAAQLGTMAAAAAGPVAATGEPTSHGRGQS
jgi:ADP-ribose pyrophosphatase YjhB (NUDIX family)